VINLLRGRKVKGEIVISGENQREQCNIFIHLLPCPSFISSRVWFCWYPLAYNTLTLWLRSEVRHNFAVGRS